jgi:hypothetical protein
LKLDPGVCSWSATAGNVTLRSAKANAVSNADELAGLIYLCIEALFLEIQVL